MAGRVILINAVLDGLLTYAMGALELPLGVRAALDARRRAFLWTCTGEVDGAQCLVAWRRCAKTKKTEDSGSKELTRVTRASFSS